MSEYAETCRDMRDIKRKLKDALGVLCEGCKVARPKAHPTIMLPQQTCRVCGNKDNRPRSLIDDFYKNETGDI